MAKVVRNPNGHPESLRPLPKGNTISAKHGVYSDRLREPRAQQIFEAIMEAPHTVPLDSIFPVLSAGLTPRTPLNEWTFTIEGGAEAVTWTWEEFRALPSEAVTVDIHCVTRWSKLDTTWQGVSVETLLEDVPNGVSCAELSITSPPGEPRSDGDDARNLTNGRFEHRRVLPRIELSLERDLPFATAASTVPGASKNR